MQTWTRAGLVLAISLTALPSAWAQPALPGAPPAPPAGFGGAATAAPAAPTKNIWSSLCPSPEQKANCKAWFCASPLGQMATAMGKPMAAMSGGLLGNCCPTNAPDPKALEEPAESSGGAAARVKKDEMEAKARRGAIRYLGTVDCRYWPEAKAALINGLRADKNECVRWEAALALQHGCCCEPEIVVALTISVAGSTSDGKPAERSDRVRDAAAVALSMCVIETPAVAPTEIKEKAPLEIPRELPGTASKDPYQKLTPQQRAQIVDNARHVLAAYYHRPITHIAAGSQPREARPVSNGLLGVVTQAVSGQAMSATSEPAVARAPGEPERSGLVYMAYNWFRGPGVGPTSVTTEPARPNSYGTGLAGWMPTGNTAATRSGTPGIVEFDR